MLVFLDCQIDVVNYSKIWILLQIMDTCKNVHHVAEKFYLLYFTKILSFYGFKFLTQDGKANCIVPIFIISLVLRSTVVSKQEICAFEPTQRI